jgi:hypothetical protein
MKHLVRILLLAFLPVLGVAEAQAQTKPKLTGNIVQAIVIDWSTCYRSGERVQRQGSS